MTNRTTRSSEGHILFRFTIALVLAGCTATLGAQQDAPEAESSSKGGQAQVLRKVIPVKHIDVKEVANLIHPWGLQMTISRPLGLISLVGDRASVESAEKIIREIDVPPPGAPRQGSENVEIVFHLLGAGGESAASEMTGNDELTGVVNELRGRFPYQSFQLLETGSLRVRAQRKAEMSGVLPGIAPGRRDPMYYHFRVRVPAVLDRQGKHLIQLGDLSLQLRVPLITGEEHAPQVHYQELNISSEMDVLEGKTVVVGKTGVLGSIRGLFLILTANVVE